jgi:hypothetical protein
MASLDIFTFQDKAIIPQDGKECLINMATEITFEISGTGNGQVVFEAKSNFEGQYIPIVAVNLSDLTMTNNTNINGINQLWQVSVTSLFSFRIRVVSVLNGYISVIGKVAK